MSQLHPFSLSDVLCSFVLSISEIQKMLQDMKLLEDEDGNLWSRFISQNLAYLSYSLNSILAEQVGPDKVTKVVLSHSVRVDNYFRHQIISPQEQQVFCYSC